MNILKNGAKGRDVIRLQILLNGALKPSPRLKIDGHFGNKTDKAVRRFQLARKLEVDGVVGPQTWQALGVSATTAKAAPPVTTVADGDGPPWYRIARAELGIREIVGAKKHTKRIVEYHSTTTLRATSDEVPWCSSFVNWVMVQAGIKGTNSALAKSWVDWGVTAASPGKGAITVIKRKNKNSDARTGSSTGYHVGFLEALSSTTVTLLGGNQSDQVKLSTFFLKSYDIIAHRVPEQRILMLPNLQEIRDLSFYC
jgi:uncharacterized protein (TIGR02594 family)